MGAIVSVITPAYNSEKYILHTIESVQRQTFGDWEMLVIDDCSTDRTRDLVEEIARKDSRIKLLCQTENAGAGAARTRGMFAAQGRYIAYLDADDLWYPEKLENQLRFMRENQCAFSCTSYEVIDDAGRPLNKFVHMLPKVDYVGFLTNNLLQTVGIMVDLGVVDRSYLVMPNLRRRQDAATWLQILKAGYPCLGMYDVLAQYRRTENSLSSNKVKAVKGVWRLYREIEHLSLPFSMYCFVRYAALAVWKRMYPGRRQKR